MIKAISGGYRNVIFTLTLLGATLASTAAQAVLIEISDTSSFAPGSGYGIDASETSSPTLLDVRFTETLTNQSFSLSAVGDFFTFNFGTVQFAEPATGPGQGIDAAETDDLGVLANIVFTSPLGGTEMVNAVGTATTGPITDAQVDYMLAWTPLTVGFGDGGQFQISLATLSFTGLTTLTQTVTVTLLALPREVTTAVPEPASLAVFGLGLLALGILARRRRA